MSAQITTVQCSYCKGTGKAERLMERSFGGEWVPAMQLPHDVADVWIASDKFAPIIWQDCDCPKCAGIGQYDVESAQCKIF